MLERTTIIHNNKIALNLDIHLDLNKTINLARVNGFKGKLQIEYTYKGEQDMEDIIITMFCINEQDKTIAAIYPYKNNKEVKKHA